MCALLVDLGDTEADMNDGVVAHLSFGHEREADLLDDAVEVDLAHPGAVLFVDLDDLAGNPETHGVTSFLRERFARGRAHRRLGAPADG